MTQNIILLDNQVFFRNTVRKLISVFPNTKIIGEANNSKELFNYFDDNIIPSIIITELDLPDIDAVELVKKVLSKYPYIIIIGLSLKNDPGKARSFINMGARGHLLKLSNNKDVFREIFENPKSRIFYSNSAKRVQKKQGKKTILVVDDFETNTYVVGLTLKNANYNIIKAKNGMEGLKIAKNPENDIDLVVADYNMPDIDGAEMIRQIRLINRYSQIPALVLSSDKSEEKKKKAETVGISAWIKKPYKISHFLKVVEMALR